MTNYQEMNCDANLFKSIWSKVNIKYIKNNIGCKESWFAYEMLDTNMFANNVILQLIMDLQSN